MSVSERIREVAAIKSLNIKDFSEAIGIAYRTVQNYLAEDRTVGSDFLAACSTKLGISSTWILTGLGDPLIAPKHPNEHPATVTNESPDFVPVPRFSVEASAGPGSLPDSEETTGFYAFNKKWLERRGLSPANLAVVAVKGDSMEPKLGNGDLILIDRAQRQIHDGFAYVLRIDDALLVKYVQQTGPGTIALVSANSLYPPRQLALADLGEADDATFALIGRVVASMHEW
jgi:phage repressor protein C with HTH and peptisase S24 domain